MSETSYKSILELIKSLETQAGTLEKGQMSRKEVEAMLHNSRELYDRLVILRYKAFEDSVKDKRSGPASEKTTAAVAPKENKRKSPLTFQLNFDQQAQMTAQENIIPRNQMSLIDAIEEEESEAAKKKIEEKVVPSGIAENTMATEKEVAENDEREKPAPDTVAIEKKMGEGPLFEEPGAEKEKNLNELLAADKEHRSLAKKLQDRPIEDLKKAIPLNQRFLFTNDLFNGEDQAYNDAVEKLNGMADIQKAEALLRDLSDRYEWKWSSDPVRHFVSMVERRHKPA